MSLESGGAPKSAQRKQKDKEHFTEQEALQQQCYPKYPSRSPLPKSEAVTVTVAAARKQASHPLQRAATPQLRGTVATEPPAKAIAAHCSTKQPGPKRVPEDVPGSNKKQKREEASQSTDGKGTSSHPPLMSIGKRYLVETKKKIGEENYRNITSPFDVKEDVKAYEVPRDASPVPQKKEPPVHSGKAKKQQRQPLQAAGRVKEAAAPAVEIQNIKKMQEQQNLKLAKLIERKSVEILHEEEGISMQQQKLKEKKRDLTELIHCTAPPTPVPDDRGASSSISAAPGEMSQTIQDSDYDYSYSDSGEAPPAAAPDNARSMTASAKAQAVSASDSEEGSSCEDSEGSESEEDTSG